MQVTKIETRRMNPNSSRSPKGDAGGVGGKMESMVWAILFALAAAAASPGPSSFVRGRLVQREGKAPAIETASHELVSAEGEPETLAVLNDKRLAGFDIELVGHYDAPGRFMVGPFYTSPSIIVHKDGKRYSAT